MMRIKGLNRKLRLSRWAIFCLALVVALTSVGVTYARMKGPKPPKDNPPVSTATCSDPFTWVATNDDGHLDYRDIYHPTDPVDPGDNHSVGEYDYWGVGDNSSSNDPGSYPAPGAPPAPGGNFPRYTKDVARTTAWIMPDPQYITVEVENSYPYYYSTVFFTLECPETSQGWIRDFVIEAVEDDPLNPTLEALTITTSLLEIDQPIPSGGEVMGALHVLVNQNAEQLATYKFRLTIYTECGPPAGPCEGQVSWLRLKYLGDVPAEIEVVQRKGDVTVFAKTVQPFEKFKFHGTTKQLTLGPEIWIFVNNGEVPIIIHTSCSKPICIGMTFPYDYDNNSPLMPPVFEIVAGESRVGGWLPSCP